jgi:archaellum component FlaC
MTELETMLLQQLKTLSRVSEQQFEQQARRLSDYERQLSLQSERIEALSRLVERLTAQLNVLSEQLESEA